jgi:hypothetical protein
MIKKSTKQKTVEYESRDIVCDLCEAEVPVGQATITLSPFIAKEQGERHGGSAAHRIDICSVDCMVKNAGAAGLLLNTKILPELRGSLPVKRASGKLSNQDLIDMMADDDYLKKAAAAKSYKSTWTDTYKSFDKYASQIK